MAHERDGRTQKPISSAEISRFQHEAEPRIRASDPISDSGKTAEKQRNSSGIWPVFSSWRRLLP